MQTILLAVIHTVFCVFQNLTRNFGFYSYLCFIAPYFHSVEGSKKIGKLRKQKVIAWSKVLYP
jgi:hypothetical protein